MEETSVRAHLPFVVMSAGDELVALTSEVVREMVSMPGVSVVPELPPHIRGMIHLRGRALPLVDLRRRLGQPSRAEQADAFVSMLQQREQDHRRWLAELYASLEERRPFRLTTDPHACAFGQWYDSFTTPDLLLATQLRRFAEPHRHIHAVGAEVVSLVAAGEHDKARRTTAAADATLNVLVRLFAETYETVRDQSREIAVIVDAAHSAYALAVDGIDSVERISSEHVDRMPVVDPGMDRPLAPFVARRAKDGRVMLLLDADALK